MDQVDYDYGHTVCIFITNETQILLVPTLGGTSCSGATRIYDYPIPADFLGAETLNMFRQMDERALEIRENSKNFWFMPKGVRSWKKFESSSLYVSIDCIDNEFRFLRWHPGPPRGYTGYQNEPDLILPRETSAQELGEAILDLFESIRQNPWNAK